MTIQDIYLDSKSTDVSINEEYPLVSKDTCVSSVKTYLGIDWGNTLSDTRHAFEESANESIEFMRRKYCINITNSTYKKASRAARKEIRLFYNGSVERHAWGAYEKFLLKKLGVSLPEEEYVVLAKQLHNILLKYLRLKPCAISLLEMARSKGMKIIIVSNANSEKLLSEIGVCGVSEFFMAVISSDACGGDKKTGLPFKVIKEKLGISLKELLMVGDRDEEDGLIVKYGGDYISGVDLCKVNELLKNLNTLG